MCCVRNSLRVSVLHEKTASCRVSAVSLQARGDGGAEAPVCRTGVAPFHGAHAEPICTSRRGSEVGVAGRHSEPLAAAPPGLLVVSTDGNGSQFIHTGSSTFHSGMVAAEGPFVVRTIESGILRGPNSAAVGVVGTRMVETCRPPERAIAEFAGVSRSSRAGG